MRASASLSASSNSGRLNRSSRCLQTALSPSVYRVVAIPAAANQLRPLHEDVNIPNQKTQRRAEAPTSSLREARLGLITRRSTKPRTATSVKAPTKAS